MFPDWLDVMKRSRHVTDDDTGLGNPGRGRRLVSSSDSSVVDENEVIVTTPNRNSRKSVHVSEGVTFSQVVASPFTMENILSERKSSPESLGTAAGADGRNDTPRTVSEQRPEVNTRLCKQTEDRKQNEND